MPFRDRRDAGRQLAGRLGHLACEHPVVVGLPRGGVPVAFEVASALGAPLDVIIVRKLGVPWQPELGMGALGEGGVCVVNDDVVTRLRVSAADLAAVMERELAEVQRRAQRFRGDRPMMDLDGKTVIVIDDGVATGGTARAALRVARAHGARRVILAVPVAAPDALAELSDDADEEIAVETPEILTAIGISYRDFTQTSDEEVVSCLEAARPPATA